MAMRAGKSFRLKRVAWAVLRGHRAGVGTGGRGSGGAAGGRWLWLVDFQVAADSGGDGVEVTFV
jgi:hypothetical protein